MDEVIIGIGINDNKKTWFPMDKRLEMIRGLFADEPRIRVEAYDCLTVDFAKEQMSYCYFTLIVTTSCLAC